MLLAKARGGRTDCRGLQASDRLRRPGWGLWALDISGWALLENEQALGIAVAYPW